MLQHLFKRWKKISQIKDNNLRIAMSLLDLQSDEGRQVSAALPQYFSKNQERSPIPLSALFRQANELAIKNGELNLQKQIVSSGACEKLFISIITFAADKEAYEAAWKNENLILPNELPKELATQILDNGKDWQDQIGTIYKWEKTEIILLEYDVVNGFFHFSPAEMVFNDLNLSAEKKGVDDKLIPQIPKKVPPKPPILIKMPSRPQTRTQ